MVINYTSRVMKFFFMTIALGFYAFSMQQAFAQSCIQTCTELSTHTSETECLNVIQSAGGEKNFEEKACSFCSSMSTNYSTIECIKAIRFKTFTYSEIDSCYVYSTNASALACIERSGRYR